MKLTTIARLLTDRRHYYTASRFLGTYAQPGDAARRYILRKGPYPASVTVRTATGPVKVALNSPDDFATLNQIFCRRDYPAPQDARIVMDLGSNIGLAALYFVKQCKEAFVYCYEPDPKNAEVLRGNLAPYENRYDLSLVAVSDFNGEASFGLEPTGRYGSLLKEAETTLTVPVIDIRDEVDRILEKHGRIDVLKVDIEGLEEKVLSRLRDDQLARIGEIYAEYAGDLQIAGFRKTQWGIVSHYRRG